MKCATLWLQPTSCDLIGTVQRNVIMASEWNENDGRQFLDPDKRPVYRACCTPRPGGASVVGWWWEDTSCLALSVALFVGINIKIYKLALELSCGARSRRVLWQ